MNSIYEENKLNIKGDTPVILSEQEVNMICNAMAILLPKECDALPIFELTDKLVKANHKINGAN